MPESNDADQITTATDQRWLAYNRTMADLFKERDTHPLDSAERTTVAERILALWVKDGG